MKIFIGLALVACACAAEYKSDAEVPVVRSDYSLTPDGAWNYLYETGNGIYGQAEGVLRNVGADNPYTEVKGQVKYTAPDGTPVELTYTADQEGYHPSGAHLPVGPPVPDYITRSIEYVAAHPPQVESAGKARIVRRDFIPGRGTIPSSGSIFGSAGKARIVRRDTIPPEIIASLSGGVGKARIERRNIPPPEVTATLLGGSTSGRSG